MGTSPAPHHKKQKNIKMKKFYVAPDAEVLLLKMTQPLLDGSNDIIDDETTDPVHVITDPNDDDFNW